MTVAIKILLNKNGFGGYAPTDQVYEALAFDTPGQISDERMREVLFHQLNVDRPGCTWAQDYRRRGHRSLSVGDVVMISDRAWACEASGWRPVNPAVIRVVPTPMDMGHPRFGR